MGGVRGVVIYAGGVGLVKPGVSVYMISDAMFIGPNYQTLILQCWCDAIPLSSAMRNHEFFHLSDLVYGSSFVLHTCSAPALHLSKKTRILTSLEGLKELVFEFFVRG